MEVITDTYTIYEFAELSDDAKATALDEGRLKSGEWWEAQWCIDSLKEVAELIGIRIQDIFFSGFWSQGNGAQFTGFYEYQRGWRAKIMAEFGPGEFRDRIIAIGADLQRIQQPWHYQLYADVKSSGRYCHEYCTDIDVSFADETQFTVYSSEPTFEDDIITALRDFMRLCYKQLESDYDSTQTDDYVIDMFESNKFTFDADGNRKD